MLTNRFRPSLELIEDRCIPAAGLLDPAFGTGGIVSSPLLLSSGLDGVAEAAATQLDGRLVLAGIVTDSSGAHPELIARRLNNDGSVDRSFGNSEGIGLISNFQFGTALAIAIQSDGSVLIANSQDSGLILFKLTSSGHLDATFGNGGRSEISLDTRFDPRAISILSDGKVLIAGTTRTVISEHVAPLLDFGIVRLTANDELDRSFGLNGKVLVNFDTPNLNEPTNDTLGGLAVQTDGQIVLVGTSYVPSQFVRGFNPGGSSRIALARLSSEGQFDSRFDSDGRVTITNPSSQFNDGNDVAIRSNGKIIVVGSTGGHKISNGYYDEALAYQLNSDGSPDTAFGASGISIVSFSSLTEKRSTAFAVQLAPNGKVVVVGTTADFDVGSTSTTRVALARLNEDGRLDASFCEGGTAIIPSAIGDRLTAVITQIAGQIVAVGTLRSANDAFNQSAVAMRFINDPVAPATPHNPLPIPTPILIGGLTTGSAVVVSPTNGSLSVSKEIIFFPGFAGTVRTASADVTGDGVADFIGATGPGGGPEVKIIDGASGATIADFFAFELSFTGGVYVAAADLDLDGKAELIITPDQGGGPVVAVYSGAKLAAGKSAEESQMVRFLGIDDSAFRGGARPAVGDINGDGVPDLIVSAGFLGGPRIAIYDGNDIIAGASTPRKLMPDFFAFEESLRNGAFVSVGDVDGDGNADLALGGGPGGAPRVRLLSGKQLLVTTDIASLSADRNRTLSPLELSMNRQVVFARSGRLIDEPEPGLQLANFFAGGPDPRGGVRLVLRDIDSDGKADLIAGSGDGEAAKLRVYKSKTVLARSDKSDQELDLFDGTVLANGVFVG